MAAFAVQRKLWGQSMPNPIDGCYRRDCRPCPGELAVA